MWTWLTNLFRRSEPKRQRQIGDRCENCIYFADHRPADPDEDNLGYCTRPYVLGIQWNEYGGFWTDGNDWCAGWEGGEPVWKMTDVTEEKGR